MVLDKHYYVYILTNKNNNVLYTGITNNIYIRLSQHKQKLVKGFTTKYNCNKLVYYEYFNDVKLAISREKEIKKWRREKKVNLINILNPEWRDLSEEW